MADYTNESFRKCLKIGKVGEQAVIDCLFKHGLPYKLNDTENKLDYDIESEIAGKKFTIEVKYDKMSCRTGNVCIEYHNDDLNSDSGILGTKANLFATVIEDGSNHVVFLTSVKRLRKFIKDVPPLKDFKMGGNNNSSFYLYKDSHILPAIYERIDTQTTDKSLKFIKLLLKEKV